MHSKSGLLTTVGYKIGDNDAIYCLEGSIAITGALVQWLRDNLKMIKAAPEVEELAESVDDNGGLYIVPAFSRPVRALLEVERPRRLRRPDPVRQRRPHRPGDARGDGLPEPARSSRRWRPTPASTLDSLKVDGGMVHNDMLMQFQADILGVPVIRPEVAETTALGAAYAAGLATGFWDNQEDLRENWAEDKRWEPQMDADKRDEYYKYWKKAVTRTFDWFE